MNTRTGTILALALVWSLWGDPSDAFKRTSIGDNLKPFSLETLDGKGVRLSESLGEKATVVVFWAAWSPRSLDLLSDLQQIYSEQGAGMLEVIAVNVEHGDWDPAEVPKIAAAIEQAGASYLSVLDKDLSVFNDYGVVAVPSAVVADGTGTVVSLLDGYPNTVRTDFRESVLKTLGVLDDTAERPVAGMGEYAPKGTAVRYFEMAKVLLRKRRATRAIAALEKAIAEDPEFVEAYELLADAFAASGRHEQAEAVLGRVVSLKGSTPDLGEGHADEEKPHSPTLQ